MEYVPNNTLIRLKQVELKTGLKRSTIYRLMSLGQFPQCVKLTNRAVGWQSSAINKWIAFRIYDSSNDGGVLTESENVKMNKKSFSQEKTND